MDLRLRISGLHGISIYCVVLRSLVSRLFYQIRIFAPFDFPLEIKAFLCPWKQRKLAWVSHFLKNLGPPLAEETVFCDFRESGGNTKILISLFFAFSVLSTVGFQKLQFFRKFDENNLFLKFQNNEAYKKCTFRPGIEIKNIQRVENFRKEVFLGSTMNHLAPKSVDRAEITKNCFLRQSWS